MFTKKCALIFSLFIAFQSVIAQTQLQEFKLKGKVKSLSSKTYAYGSSTQFEVSGFLDSEMYNAIDLEFSPFGKLICKTQYLDYRGKLGVFDVTNYFYNPQQQLEKLETTLIQNGEEPKRISQIRKYYYLNNQLIREDEFNYGRTTQQYWVFNHAYYGNKLLKKTTWMEDEVFTQTLYTYNFNGEIQSQIDRFNNGKVGKSIAQRFDVKTQTKTIETTYGNQKSKEEFKFLTPNSFTYLQWDDQNKLIKQVENDSYANPKSAQIYKPNQNQLVKFEFKYEFDSENNWIQCTIFEQNIPKYTILRYITYY